MLDNISSKFKGSVFTYAAAAALAPPPCCRCAHRAAAAGAPRAAREGLLAAGRLNLVSSISVFRPPREIFNPPRGDDDTVEPLVDIMVVDELLDPYRDQLAKTMSGRIDDAIAALSGNGGIFTGINTYTAVNKSIANAFTLNQFLWQGALAGRVDFGQLVQLINKGKEPIFYVVFARRRPAAVSRPLRL